MGMAKSNVIFYKLEDNVAIELYSKYDTTTPEYVDLLELEVNKHLTFSLSKLKTYNAAINKIKRETPKRFMFRLLYKWPPTGRIWRVADNTVFKKLKNKPLTKF